jgi:peptide deformylase
MEPHQIRARRAEAVQQHHHRAITAAVSITTTSDDTLEPTERLHAHRRLLPRTSILAPLRARTQNVSADEEAARTMAIRTILHYPDKRLRTPGTTVTDFGDAFQALVEDMAETMYAAPGVGLAAPQIGVAQRLFVIDIASADEPSDLRVFVNPRIVEASGEICWEEGCLSFPGVTEEIDRAERVTVRAQDRHGKTFELEAEGLLAIAIQHENDHLDGKLMVDHVGMLKRRMIDRAMRKRAAEANA